MRISRNFTRDEFRCKCGECRHEGADIVLVTILQSLRDWAGGSVKINSGNRCPAYNKKIGGSKDSYHMKAMAADVVVDGKTPREVYTWLCTTYRFRFGFILYDWGVHIDSRTEAYRSDRTTK